MREGLRPYLHVSYSLINGIFKKLDKDAYLQIRLRINRFCTLPKKHAQTFRLAIDDHHAYAHIMCNYTTDTRRTRHPQRHGHRRALRRRGESLDRHRRIFRGTRRLIRKARMLLRGWPQGRFREYAFPRGEDERVPRGVLRRTWAGI